MTTIPIEVMGIEPLRVELISTIRANKLLNRRVAELEAELALLQWRSVDELPEEGMRVNVLDVDGNPLNLWLIGGTYKDVKNWAYRGITKWQQVFLPEPKEHDCKYSRIEMAGKIPMVMCGCTKKDWQEGTVCGESSYKNCRYGEPKESSNDNLPAES